MKIVSNASPLINLAWIGKLDLLHVLGILSMAKQQGIVSEVKPLIALLRSRAGFYIKPDLIAYVLRSFSEQ